MKHLNALLLGACLLPFEVQALEYRWQSALLASSPRLLAFSMEEHGVPKGGSAFLLSYLKRDGQLHREGGGAQRVYSYASAAPLIGYDANLNNGFQSEYVKIAGLTFRISDESRAKAGVTVGAGLTTGIGWSIHKGVVASLSASLSYQHSPKHEIGELNAALQGCIGHHQLDWWWFDYCVGSRYSEKASTIIEEEFASARMTRIFSSSLADHELALGVSHRLRDSYDKTSATISLTSASENIGVVGFSLEAGRWVEGENTTLFRTSTWLTRPFFDRKTTFLASYRETGGAKFFGLERRDSIYRMQVESDVTEAISLKVGYEWASSSVEAYNSSAVLFGVDLKDWKFH